MTCVEGFFALGFDDVAEAITCKSFHCSVAMRLSRISLAFTAMLAKLSKILQSIEKL
jgi:hypothetical protein